MADNYAIEDELEIETDSAPKEPKLSPTDKKLEQTYQKGRLRVVQERNDFFLPHVLDFIKGRKWGNLVPEYQRRLRWDNKKKSRLIESFLMNVPVPPVFLFDASSGELEVLDGQQRITTVVDFLGDKFNLEGLEIWPALNGRNFSRLPPALRKGLERSKLSAITLITDETGKKGEIDLRSQVFDRLNTGGEKLNFQELRNCLFSGPFNRLIVELAANPGFTKAWNIPSHKDHTLSDGSYDEKLRDDKLFSTMGDCQIVLRFFAFKEEEHVVGSTREILDNCMKRLRRPKVDILKSLREEFVQTLDTAIAVFGDRAFRVQFNDRKKGRLSRPLFDAEMIALLKLRDRWPRIIEKKDQVRSAIQKLVSEDSEEYADVVGRPNTAGAIKRRISIVQDAIAATVK